MYSLTEHLNNCQLKDVAYGFEYLWDQFHCGAPYPTTSWVGRNLAFYLINLLSIQLAITWMKNVNAQSESPSLCTAMAIIKGWLLTLLATSLFLYRMLNEFSINTRFQYILFESFWPIYLLLSLRRRKKYTFLEHIYLL